MDCILLVEEEQGVAASIGTVTSRHGETRHVAQVKDAIAAVRAPGVQLAFKPLGVREIESFLSRARAELPAARIDTAFDALTVRVG